jgi:lipid II:glycine glycyltransferase (peptidoglycan interpeptide bridge formation enzyme)
MTRRRQGLPPQPIAWFRRLIGAFGSGLKIRVAYKGDLPVASILTLSDTKSMVYKYGCSDVRFHRLGGMQLLLWNAIKEAKENGCEDLDMGRSNTNNVGLITFKKRWGAIERELSYWTYPLRPQAQPTIWQKRLLQNVVSISPDVALKAVGNLLYRHVG